jgi:predicted dinucleotide-binding enzyme
VLNGFLGAWASVLIVLEENADLVRGKIVITTRTAPAAPLASSPEIKKVMTTTSSARMV